MIIMELAVPSKNVVTGYEVEKRSVTWTIEDFPLIRKHTSMINSQWIDFSSGEATGHPSQWMVSLLERTIDEKRWIGVYLKLEGPNRNDAVLKTSHSEVGFTVKNKEGKIVKDENTGPMLIGSKFKGAYSYEGSPPVGCNTFIDADEETNDCPGESLVIHISFTLYRPSRLESTSSLETIMAKFQDKFLEQRWKDLSGLIENPIPPTEIKIISSDKKEFSMQKAILGARSEVFAAMLSSDMIEANSGVVELSDISSNALEVLLNFLSTGKLLPEWREIDVIEELTYAAAKYQLKDLLQFLDLTIGKVCKLPNVGPLLILSRRLALEVAEKGLIMYVKREWEGCADNFIKMWSPELLEADEESGEPQEKKQKLNSDSQSSSEADLVVLVKID